MSYALVLCDLIVILLGLLAIRAIRQSPTIDYAPPIYDEGYTPVDSLHLED